MKEMYLAEFCYGKANLACLNIIRETEKTIFFDDYKDIFGRQWLRKRLLKDRQACLASSKEEAIAYLLSRIEMRKESLREELIRLEKVEGFLRNES